MTARDNTFYDPQGNPVQGTREFLYPNGQVMFRETMEQGRLNGARSLYREDGALIWQYHFRDGLAEGRASEHYQDGSVRAYKYYRNHKFYKEEEMDPAGRIIFAGQYSEPEPVAVQNVSEIRAGQFGR